MIGRAHDSIHFCNSKSLALGRTPRGTGVLLRDLRTMIQQGRKDVARRVDSTLATLYWNIGQRIRQDILKKKRAEYGKEIVSAMGRQLPADFGQEFSEKSLSHMIRFAAVFPDEEILSALRRELTWTHFKSLIYLEDPLKRDFYAERCRVERWNTRTLAKKISGMLFVGTGAFVNH